MSIEAQLSDDRRGRNEGAGRFVVLWKMTAKNLQARLIGGVGSRQIGLLLLIVTALGWGINWPVMKALLHEMPPLSARGWAGMTAAAMLALLSKALGERLTIPRGSFGVLLFAAGTNVTAWMGLSTLSMLWLNVSEGALLVYTMPIWTAFIAWPILGRRPRSWEILAVALGISGIVVILGGSGFAPGAGKVYGVLLALAAAVLFAFGAVISQSSSLRMPAIASVAWQIGLGCLPMVVYGALFERPNLASLSLQGWAAIAYMTLAPMGVCYLSWFAALRRLPATTAAMATFLTPIIGVTAAALGLGEPIGPRQCIALALTLGGVSLALWGSKTS